MKKGILIYIPLFLIFLQNACAQIELEDVVSIYVIDQYYFSTDSTWSFSYELKFNDSIELWDTKELSKADFDMTYNKEKVERFLDLIGSGFKEPSDESGLMLEKLSREMQADYDHYCDTVSGEFIKHVDKEHVIRLVNAVQDKKAGRKPLELTEGSHASFVAFSITCQQGDTIIAYSSAKTDVILPWTVNVLKKDSYNIEINQALWAIMPDNGSPNRERLITLVE